MAWSEAARAAALEARRRSGMSKHGGGNWQLAHGRGVAWLKAGRTSESAGRLRQLKALREERAKKKKLGFHPSPRSSIGLSEKNAKRWGRSPKKTGAFDKGGALHGLQHTVAHKKYD